MSSFSKEQIEQANSINLIDFARQNGCRLEKGGRKAFHAKDSGGLYFFKDENRYYNFSKGTGGGPIDFVMSYLNKNFPEAVELLIGASSSLSTKTNENLASYMKGDLELPPKAENCSCVYSYLTQTRGIDREIVFSLIEQEKIYQQKDNANCVFVACDRDGKARYCSLRGTYNKPFKMDKENSDKSFPFHIEGTSNKLFVFESPIDAMSHATLTKIYNRDWKEDHRISLGGVSDLALERFLDENPNIKFITFCLDNDKTGHSRTLDLFKKYCGGYVITTQTPMKNDVNEDLLFYRKSLNDRIGENQMEEHER